jgi:hypothetical protein
VVPSIFGFGQFAVGSFGILFSGSKNKLLDYASDFVRLGSFRTLFWSSNFRADPARLSRARTDKRAGSQSGQEVETGHSLLVTLTHRGSETKLKRVARWNRTVTFTYFHNSIARRFRGWGVKPETPRSNRLRNANAKLRTCDKASTSRRVRNSTQLVVDRSEDSGPLASRTGFAKNQYKKT